MKKTRKLSIHLASILSVGSVTLSACGSDNKSFIDKKVVTLSSTQLGSMNYALEQPDGSNNDVLQMLVEPLIKFATPKVIQPFLSLDHNIRNYNAKDQAGKKSHALDFDVKTIKKDKNGFYDPRNYNGKNATTDDTYSEDGNGWEPIANYESGAADVIVSLTDEEALFRFSSADRTKAKNRIMRLHIRDNLKWSNGDPVTPKDYVSNVKYILDPKLGSSSYNFIVNTLRIKGADKCYSERSQLLAKHPSWSGDQTWTSANSCQSIVNQKDTNNSGLGIRDLGNNWLEFEFEGSNDDIFTLLGSSSLLPINEKFVNTLPRKILDYGLSADTFLSNGAMTLKEFMPDYQLIGEKNPNYWGSQDVFSSGVQLRAISNQYARINLFKNGFISEISSIPPQFLPILNNIPEIAKTVRRGSGTSVVQMLRFSPWFLNQNPNTKYMNDPDFRRALYYGLDRVATLEAQTFFGVIPSGLIFPAGGIQDFPRAGNDNLYTIAQKTEFTPDMPGAQKYNLAQVDYNDVSINRFNNFLGQSPVDYNHKPELAKQFMKRWVDKYKIKNPTLPFEFTADDEKLAISLKKQYENLFSDFGFKLDLKPELGTNLTTKQFVGNYSFSSGPFSAASYGTSSFNWFLPFVTTTFAGDRRFTNLTIFPGETAGSYARELAKTPHGVQRLKQMGLDPDPYSVTKAAAYWKLLQTLDNYIENDDPKLNSLPTIGLNNNIKYGSDLAWNSPKFMTEPDKQKNYIFRVANSIGGNGQNVFIKNGVLISNPLLPSSSNSYGINNGYQFADFLLILQKLIIDGAFAIPIAGYSSFYFANQLNGVTGSGAFGMPRNLVHSYRYDANLQNSKNQKLPGEEALLL